MGEAILGHFQNINFAGSTPTEPFTLTRSLTSYTFSSEHDKILFWVLREPTKNTSSYYTYIYTEAVSPIYTCNRGEASSTSNYIYYWKIPVYMSGEIKDASLEKFYIPKVTLDSTGLQVTGTSIDTEAKISGMGV